MDNFIDVVKEIFENPEKMDPADIQKLIMETNRYFASLEKTMNSGDENAQEEAMAKAMELKSFLESKMAVFAPFMGREPTAEEQATIAQINQNLPTKKHNKIKPTKLS